VELVFQLLELGLGLLENNSKFSTIFIVGLLNATAVNVGFSLISMYAELYFHAPKIYIGLLSSIRAFATLLMAVPLGILSDRWGRKPVVTLSLLLGLTSLTTLFVAQDISMLAVSTLAGGVMWAAFGPSMQALIADISSPANAGKLVGLYTIAPSVGMFLAPMIGSLLLGLMTMRDIFFLHQ
jgi:DHA1 family multidrug resistance protein-like MFS transporter